MPATSLAARSSWEPKGVWSRPASAGGRSARWGGQMWTWESMIMRLALLRCAVASHVIRGLDLRIHPDRIQDRSIVPKDAVGATTRVAPTAPTRGPEQHAERDHRNGSASRPPPFGCRIDLSGPAMRIACRSKCGSLGPRLGLSVPAAFDWREAGAPPRQRVAAARRLLEPAAH